MLHRMLHRMSQAVTPIAGQSPSFGPKSRPGGGGSRAFTKIVAMVPVRDEAHLLPSTLRALSHLVDATVVLDDCSADGSGDTARSLAEECKVSEHPRKQRLSDVSQCRRKDQT